MRLKWSTDDSEAGEAKILKRSCFTGSVKKRVQEQGDVSRQECRAGRNKHTCIWKALNVSKHRPWCSLRPITTWFPNGTTDRVSTELETLHLNQQHNITSHVKYTSRSLSTENSAVGIVSVCVLITASPHARPHTAAAPMRYTLCWTDEPSVLRG